MEPGTSRQSLSAGSPCPTRQRWTGPADVHPDVCKLELCSQLLEVTVV